MVRMVSKDRLTRQAILRFARRAEVQNVEDREQFVVDQAQNRLRVRSFEGLSEDLANANCRHE